MEEICLFIYMFGLKSVFKQGARSTIHAVKRLRVAVENPLYASGNRGFAILPKQKMIMIGHQTISNYCDVVAAGVFLDAPQQITIVLITSKDVLTVGATIENVVVISCDEARFSSGHDFLFCFIINFPGTCQVPGKYNIPMPLGRSQQQTSFLPHLNRKAAGHHYGVSENPSMCPWPYKPGL
jgi:hypothetical protein